MDEEPIGRVAATTSPAIGLPAPDPTVPGRPRPEAFTVAGVPLFQPVDAGVWAFVLLFFCGAAILGGGDLLRSVIGAAGIVGVMFLVGFSIEVVIESLKDIRGLGTVVGFVTNGPEALCLVVGMAVGDLRFAASTPLGSNFMNPVLLLIAAILTGSVLRALLCHPVHLAVAVTLTAAIAGSFFLIPESAYTLWQGVALAASLAVFLTRPPDPGAEGDDGGAVARRWLLPALAVLTAAGWLLDPVVTFTARHACAPKGVIGFFVLATLTSWPEFKSCLVLFRRRRPVSAVLNITVSNVTNLWLAWVGILVWRLFG